MWNAAEKLTEHDPPPNFGIWSRVELEAEMPKGRKPQATKAPAKAHQRGKKHPPGCPHCASVRTPEHRAAAKARAIDQHRVTSRKASGADGDREERHEV